MHSLKLSNAENGFEMKGRRILHSCSNEYRKTDKMLNKASELNIFSNLFNKLSLMERAHVRSCLSTTY